jgi:ankyrin repeat protein
MIPVLLEAGADIEGVDAKGHTALVLATYHGFEKTAALLLDRGADPNGATASGSPLMGVAFKGHLPIADQCSPPVRTRTCATLRDRPRL